MSTLERTFVRTLLAVAIVLAIQTAARATPFLSVGIEASSGSTFTLTTNGSGNATLYAWGGNGVDGNSSSTGINPYINGFTIESVPEPATCVLVGLGGTILLIRRKKS
jgi:hypothetical protein